VSGPFDDQSSAGSGMPEGGTAGPSGSESGESSVKALMATGGTIVGGLLLNTALDAANVSERVASKLLAGYVAVMAICYAARCITHAEIGYGRSGAERAKWALVALFDIEVVLTLFFLAIGPITFFGDRSGHDACLLQLKLVSVFLVLAFIHALCLSAVIERLPDVDRGSDVSQHCRIVRLLNWVGHRVRLGFVVEFFMRPGLRTQLSVMMIWILISLGGVAAGDVSTVVQFAPGGSGDEKQVDDNIEGSTSTPSTTSTSPTTTTSTIPDPEDDASSDTTQKATSDHPSYEDLCGRHARPGRGRDVPKAVADEIYDLWLGSPDGLGAIYAGCAEPAHRVGESLTWVAAGMCNEDFRSLAVVDGKGGHQAILRLRPAEFALARFKDTTLVSATSQRKTGNGDYYTVTTTSGTYVFARSVLSDGTGPLHGDPRTCADIHRDPVGFVKMPPPLSWLWLYQMTDESTWYWPSTADGHHFTFKGSDPAGHRITGDCPRTNQCVITVDGTEASATGARVLDPARIARIAPPPSRSSKALVGPPVAEATP
jgi:hypothetical protein